MMVLSGFFIIVVARSYGVYSDYKILKRVLSKQLVLCYTLGIEKNKND